MTKLRSSQDKEKEPRAKSAKKGRWATTVIRDGMSRKLCSVSTKSQKGFVFAEGQVRRGEVGLTPETVKTFTQFRGFPAAGV